MDRDRWVAYGFIAFWIFSILLSLGFVGLIIWAIIRFVLKYT